MIKTSSAITSNNAWDLWHERFKLGDEVIIITEDDKMFAGKIRWDDEGCSVRTPLGHHHHFCWEEVTMVCNDGFPVKKLIGADGSASALKEPTVKDVHEPDTYFKSMSAITRRRRSGSFRDPFSFEDVYVGIVNPGLKYDPYSLYEECLTLDAPNGARGLLWDLDQIFRLEA